ncbi:MAG: OB-fold nucleic acid binding domain-containing protein [Candidatus Marsarchaeota archaeon]|nr:OB-fold nucleic acid binding domain-containing protein [Candidatus Marsarchaeota archaeon]
MVDDFKLDKLKKLKEKGMDAYPYSFKQSAHAAEIKSGYEKHEGKKVSIAGRALSIRHMGQLYFIDLLDETDKIQVLAATNLTKKESMELLELVDSGDFLGVSGKVSKTKRGEISVEAEP